MNKIQVIEKALKAIEEFTGNQFSIIPLLDLQAHLQEELKTELYNNCETHTPSDKRRAKAITSFVKRIEREGYRGYAFNTQGLKVITDTYLMIIFNAQIPLPATFEKMQVNIPASRIDEIEALALEAEGTEVQIEYSRLLYLKKMKYEVITIEGNNFALPVLLNAFKVTDSKSLLFKIPQDIYKAAHFTTSDCLISGVVAGCHSKTGFKNRTDYKEATT